MPRCSDAGFVDGERALAAGGVPLGDLYVLDPAAAAPAFIAVQQASRMMMCKAPLTDAAPRQLSKTIQITCGPRD